ncbi:hypothetical protein [Cohnella lupini]|uniref:Uncharacterized protein n=1 Tax=Cohnella lupini TaxID=1294267 RepID=A0A3D9HV82_9BACL|nr:hypothetical protein [Cohnella lupini]RED52806.1 hypothetical protein DFP95_13010 [Cohnella lupini]
MNEADDSFDAIILIMVLAIFTPVMIYCAIPFFKGDVGGFGVQIEKAAPSTESEIVPTRRVIKANDILLMLVVADKYAPQPKKITLNPSGSPSEFSLDSAFLNNKALYLQDAKAALPANVNVRLSLYSGPSGMRFWGVNP